MATKATKKVNYQFLKDQKKAKKAAPAKKAKAATPTTKSAILADLATTGGITKTQITAIFDRLVAIAYAGAKDAKGIVIPGIGKFSKQKKPARKGRNPATGETMKIPAKTVVKFKVAKAFTDAIQAK